MRRACLALALCFLVEGCGTHRKLPEQGAADVVKITTLAGFPKLPRKEIRDKARIAALVSFVNSLPNRWGVPWYGPSVGRVYFEFISGKKYSGNFYVGTDFFGRDADRHYSQDASRERIEALGKIVELDLWTYVNGSGSGPSPQPTAAPPALQPPATGVAPASGQPAAQHAAPAATQPARQP